MAVQQEMAEIHPPDAEELSELLPATDRRQCGFGVVSSLRRFLSKGEQEYPSVPDLAVDFPEIFGPF